MSAAGRERGFAAPASGRPVTRNGAVLILDGGQKSALAVLRSLARHGVACDVGESYLPNLCSRSRHCRRAFTYPSPYRSIADFQAFMARWLSENDYQAVFPLTDATLPPLFELDQVRRGGLLRGYALADRYARASDKQRLIELAASLGVPVPETTVVDRTTDLERFARRSAFPAVVKPVLSRIAVDGRCVAQGVAIVREAEEMAARLRALLALSPSCLVQRVIPGEGIGLFALYREGVPRRLFLHRRLLEKPPSGGISVLCESIAGESDLVAHGLRLLDAMGWHGVAMVEFKKETGSGTPYLMEVNARLWGSLQLAVASGVDFPYDILRLARGEALPQSNPGYIPGVRCGSITGVVDHFYLLLKARRFDRMTASLRTLLGGLDFREFVFDRRDPKPFLHEIRNYIRP